VGNSFHLTFVEATTVVELNLHFLRLFHYWQNSYSSNDAKFTTTATEIVATTIAD
jgi:hypothetical protein